MTDKQLEKLGIYRDGGKVRPNRYWCNTTQDHWIIYKSDTMEQILALVFENGKEQGIVEGKIQRSNQFSDLLNNTDC